MRRARPDGERHALAAPRARSREVAPGKPPGVAGGDLEEPDPGRRGCGRGGPPSSEERRPQRVGRLVPRASREERPRHPAPADRQPPLAAPGLDLLPLKIHLADAAAGRWVHQLDCLLALSSTLPEMKTRVGILPFPIETLSNRCRLSQRERRRRRTRPAAASPPTWRSNAAAGSGAVGAPASLFEHRERELRDRFPAASGSQATAVGWVLGAGD
jgi:hypothetical protein